MKRAYPPENPYAPTATTSAAALSRQAVSSRAYPATRSSSPPASTYFTPYDGGHHGDPQPATPEANAHFAYSTTLRRHRAEGPLGLGTPGSANGFPKLEELRTVVEEEGPSGLWQRTVGLVKGLLSKDEGYEKLATPMVSDNRETPSAIFAHRSVEVRLPLAWDIRTPLIQCNYFAGHTRTLRSLAVNRTAVRRHSRITGTTWIQ